MLKIALIALVVLAIVTVQTQMMRVAVIFLGAFSLTISFVFLLYSAPDVALAEAVVGSTLSTILYLVALQKYKIFTIYYSLTEDEFESQEHLSSEHLQFKKMFEKFCAKQELEPQFIYTVETFDQITKSHQYALIILNEPHKITIWGHPENYKLDSLEKFLEAENPSNVPIDIIKVEEVFE